MSQANNPSAIISTERVFSVPRRKVFAAFEQPDQLARWWGAEGFHELVRAVRVQPRRPHKPIVEFGGGLRDYR